MTTDDRLRCVIIGEGTLPVVCGEMLRERGHTILALISPDAPALRWARSNGIAHAMGLSELPALMGSQPFDYLFSIVNFQRLPETLLKAATRYAINYHDAPLPRYAGMHATSWALLNGETDYAVTWHAMTRRTDAGDILKQVPVEIDPDETALSLNAKCYEAAIIGFRALLDDMEAGAIDPRPQDPRERSFFRRSRRPAAGCTLPFDAPAEHLHALLRALDFGPYPNPLGLPKIALGDSFAIVTELEVLESRSGDIPGTIVAITAEHLVVTTTSDDVALAGFFTIDGVPMEIPAVVALGGLRPGARLAAVPSERAARLTALCGEFSGHESFWLAQLSGAQPTTLLPGLHPSDRLQQVASHRMALEATWLTPAAGERAADRLLAAFMVYLARLTGAGTVAIGFGFTRLYGEIGDLHPFFSAALPLRVACDQQGTFSQFAHVVNVHMEHLRGRGSYARDAPLRDPDLRAQIAGTAPSAWPIFVEILDGTEGAWIQPPPERVLTVRFQIEGKACTLLHDPQVLDPASVESIARQFLIFLRALPSCTDQPIRTLPLLEAVARGAGTAEPDSNPIEVDPPRSKAPGFPCATSGSGDRFGLPMSGKPLSPNE